MLSKRKFFYHDRLSTGALIASEDLTVSHVRASLKGSQ